MDERQMQRQMDRLDREAVAQRRRSLRGEIRPARSVGVVVQMMRFKSHSEDGDHIVCRTWDGANEGATDVMVALAPELRRTPYDGETIDGVTYNYASASERTVSDGEYSEEQEIGPAFVADETVLFALKNVVGGTGAKKDDQPIVWQDMNIASRRWITRC